MPPPLPYFCLEVFVFKLHCFSSVCSLISVIMRLYLSHVTCKCRKCAPIANLKKNLNTTNMFTSIVMPGLSFSTSANSRCSFRCLRFALLRLMRMQLLSGPCTLWHQMGLISRTSRFWKGFSLESGTSGTSRFADRLETRSSRSFETCHDVGPSMCFMCKSLKCLNDLMSNEIRGCQRNALLFFFFKVLPLLVIEHTELYVPAGAGCPVSCCQLFLYSFFISH